MRKQMIDTIIRQKLFTFAHYYIRSPERIHTWDAIMPQWRVLCVRIQPLY